MSKYVIRFACGHRRTRKNQNAHAGCLKCWKAHLDRIRVLAIAACAAKRERVRHSA